MTAPSWVEIGRLALRVEGDTWVAYYAHPDTMAGALILASVKLRFVQTPERREAFMAVARNAVGDLVEEATGQRPHWSGITPAPEREKSGSA